MAQDFTIIGLGDLLWDMFPTGKVLGGAAANFAYHASVLGNKSFIVSRVGTDSLGRELLEKLRALKLSTDFIQIDEIAPTGTVAVELDPKGQPKFTIAENVAWDFLEWTNEWEELARKASAVCFGSLVQRSNLSYFTIKHWLRAVPDSCLRVFDVNLRPPFVIADRIIESLRMADIVKLNDAELTQIIRMTGIKNANLKTNCLALLDTFGLKLVCLTRGERGCMLVTENKTVEHPGFRVKVADAVGAGDAFTAALIHHFLRGSTLEKTAEAANRLGSFVASKPGATPQIDRNILNQITAIQKPRQ